MLKTTGRSLAAFIGVLVLTSRAYADQLQPGTPDAYSAVPPIPPVVQPAPTPAAGPSRLAAGLVLGSGAVAILAGTTIALAATSDWGYPNRLGLGIACVGVPLAMVGTMLWFNVPRSATQVSIGPSTLAIVGRF